GVARALAADPPVMLMDEPFGATDPITRERLQNEFLRLQQEIRKTVVFVTHDIDEAIKMGDRIAILREHGELVQYDTPESILANPANDFVAQFVGADRGLKRLALTRLDEIELDDASAAQNQGDGSVPCTATLRDALSAMMSDSMRPLLVVDADGAPTGSVSIELINKALRRGRSETEPTAQRP
ncbi:MAG: ABC transporter ATP-binding protein, partial [Jatrophihabitantaceae bacterium]